MVNKKQEQRIKEIIRERFSCIKYLHIQIYNSIKCIHIMVYTYYSYTQYFQEINLHIMVTSYSLT
jgi:hypothetical protein